jgi:aspartokinase-like uncharacterized kinase
VRGGGGLQCALPQLAPVLCVSEHPFLIVPGGGIFADAVRQGRIADEAAQGMAIAAMEQFGWCIASGGLATTDHPADLKEPVSFFPSPA